MGRHDATEEGRADDWTSCDGENRADPDSWADPDIVTEPWATAEREQAQVEVATIQV